MPEFHAQVPYVPYDAESARLTTPETRSPDDYLNVQARPQEEVGQALQKAGGELQGTGEKAVDLATHFAQMATEAKANDIIANQFAPAAAILKQNFYSKQGMDAVKAQPEYIQSLQNLRTQFSEQATSPYEKVLLSNWMQRHAAQEIDGAGLYADHQMTQFEDQSHQAILNTTANSIVGNYNNPSLVDQNMKVADALILKHGLDRGEDQDTTIADKQMQFRGAVVKDMVTRASSLGDIPSAMNIYNSYKGQISPKDQKELDASLAPKISDYDSRVISEHVLGLHTEQFNKQVYGSSSNAFNIGNVKTAEGAANNTSQFQNPVTPEDGVTLAANNLRSNYKGLTLQQIGGKWAPPSENSTSDWVKNVSAASGIAPGVVPDLNDPQVLKNLVHGIGVAEKSSGDLSHFTPDILDKGIQASLAGKAPALNEIPTNGKALPNTADYYKANYSNIIADARAEAEKQRPNDIDFAEKTEQKTKQRMDGIIEQFKKNSEANSDIVTRAVNGDFTKDTKPGSIEEMTAINPQVQKAWSDLQDNDPKAAAAIAKTIGTKPDGKLGSGFSYLQQQAYQGKLGINDVLYHVGDDLTQDGFNKIKEIIKPNPTPDERSDNEQMATFLKYGHERIVHDHIFGNTSDAETAYQGWQLSVAQAIKENNAEGGKKLPLAQLLDKNSKDYVGGNMGQFIKPLHQQLNDRAARIQELGKTLPPLSQDRMRLPNETPDAYLARINK